MAKYGTTALRTVELLRGGSERADAAWRQVANEAFPDAPDARNKSCPREAFMGLYRAGLIRGVPAGTGEEAAIGRNGTYAITATRLLVSEPELASGSKIELWRRVMEKLGENPTKKHNGQMDVVLALWAKRLIDTSAVPAADVRSQDMRGRG